jgi:prophage regulatory protein
MPELKFKFLRERQIRAIIPIARSTLWHWVKRGKFPKPKKLSRGVTVWRSSDVEEWIAAQEKRGAEHG